MSKSKIARIAGFTVALGATASLVGFAASGTGAYFTDSQNATLQGSTGHLRINAQNTNLNFTDLIPGQDQSDTITYSTDSSSDVNEDVWLYFPGGDPYAHLTGNSGDGVGDGNGGFGGLGRYGHLAVSNSGSQTVFSSYNLSDSDATDTTSGCADANGHGSNSPASSPSDTTNGYCGVPHYILLDSNLPNGTSGHTTITFGVTGKWTAQRATIGSVPFQVVATQHGVRPDAQNF